MYIYNVYRVCRKNNLYMFFYVSSMWTFGNFSFALVSIFNTLTCHAVKLKNRVFQKVCTHKKN